MKSAWVNVTWVLSYTLVVCTETCWRIWNARKHTEGDGGASEDIYKCRKAWGCCQTAGSDVPSAGKPVVHELCHRILEPWWLTAETEFMMRGLKFSHGEYWDYGLLGFNMI